MIKPQIRRNEMKHETKNNEQNATELIEGMTEVHEAELDAIAGAMMSDCPKWPNTSKSWGF
jgi:hypothetical protein